MLDESREAIIEWLHRADHDIRIAQDMLKDETPLTDVILYHCHQSEENCVRAFHMYVMECGPRSTDSVESNDSNGANSSEAENQEPEAGMLADFGYETRNPGDLRDVSMSEAEEAVRRASNLINFVVAKMTDL